MQASSVKLHYQTGCVHCDIKKWREKNVIHKRAGHKQIKALKGRVQNKIVSCSARGNVWRLRWFQTLACRTPKRCHVGYMICVKETLTNIVCGVRQNPSVNRYFIEKTNLHYFCVFTEDWKMKIQLAALCLGLTRHRACRSKANFFLVTMSVLINIAFWWRIRKMWKPVRGSSFTSKAITHECNKLYFSWH